ncbi:MAG: alpha/beta hydrolase [Candidatus Micrarchaeota archaeon]|nr:alpha/beta hydrolase [Candidatus Micrarchaeota archaeon]
MQAGNFKSGEIQRVVIIHGTNGSNAIHWQSWLARKCKYARLETVFPKLPDRSGIPKLSAWLEALDRALPIIDKTTAIIAHSSGCSVALQLLKARTDATPGLVILVAPVSPSRVLVEAKNPELRDALLKFHEGLENGEVSLLANRISKRQVIYSPGDRWVEPDIAAKLTVEFRADVTILSIDSAHINIASGHHTYPPILDAILRDPHRDLFYEPIKRIY